MTEIVELSARRAPVTYTVTITHHWDGVLEVFVAGVAGDERSRASVGNALARAAASFGAWPLDEADELNRAALRRIDALMGAEANTPEGRELSELAGVVQAYEAKRYPGQTEAARREAEVPTMRADGWRSDCPKCVASKFACDEHRKTDAPPPPAPDELVRRLRDKCNGSPAKIEWPHRILHEAADAIEALRAEREQLRTHRDQWRKSYENACQWHAEAIERAEAAEADAKRMREALEKMLEADDEDFDGRNWWKLVEQARAALAQGGDDRLRDDNATARTADEMPGLTKLLGGEK